MEMRSKEFIKFSTIAEARAFFESKNIAFPKSGSDEEIIAFANYLAGHTKSLREGNSNLFR